MSHESNTKHFVGPPANSENTDTQHFELCGLWLHYMHKQYTMASHSNVYETEESLNMYLGLHYPSSGVHEGVAAILEHSNAPIHGLRFPQRVASLLVRLKPKQTNNRALDIGCAVGGASFELAKTFDHVDAFDCRCVYSGYHVTMCLSFLAHLVFNRNI
jgi:2-polyprenyl-3-methyl-5-hydroxy-6-metoxy-1,4-benzoquinol methylase